eukprot:TRINITY_DN8810_c0_g1_i1.p1 TRINITY_DN8810_c0_g1~~TRINITY_DN8810_c0_g1_i1.p1  ORF type:complete len:852 (+),score=233.99 TRINITY_DN8810_c0_g1_i1:118-2673(+)
MSTRPSLAAPPLGVSQHSQHFVQESDDGPDHLIMDEGPDQMDEDNEMENEIDTDQATPPQLQPYTLPDLHGNNHHQSHAAATHHQQQQCWLVKCCVCEKGPPTHFIYEGTPPANGQPNREPTWLEICWLTLYALTLNATYIEENNTTNVVIPPGPKYFSLKKHICPFISTHCQSLNHALPTNWKMMVNGTLFHYKNEIFISGLHDIKKTGLYRLVTITDPYTSLIPRKAYKKRRNNLEPNAPPSPISPTSESILRLENGKSEIKRDNSINNNNNSTSHAVLSTPSPKVPHASSVIVNKPEEDGVERKRRRVNFTTDAEKELLEQYFVKHGNNVSIEFKDLLEKLGSGWDTVRARVWLNNKKYYNLKRGITVASSAHQPALNPVNHSATSTTSTSSTANGNSFVPNTISLNNNNGETHNSTPVNLEEKGTNFNATINAILNSTPPTTHTSTNTTTTSNTITLTTAETISPIMSPIHNTVQNPQSPTNIPSVQTTPMQSRRGRRPRVTLPVQTHAQLHTNTPQAPSHSLNSGNKTAQNLVSAFPLPSDSTGLYPHTIEAYDRYIEYLQNRLGEEQGTSRDAKIDVIMLSKRICDLEMVVVKERKKTRDLQIEHTEKKPNTHPSNTTSTTQTTRSESTNTQTEITDSKDNNNSHTNFTDNDSDSNKNSDKSPKSPKSPELIDVTNSESKPASNTSNSDHSNSSNSNSNNSNSNNKDKDNINDSNTVDESTIIRHQIEQYQLILQDERNKIFELQQTITHQANQIHLLTLQLIQKESAKQNENSERIEEETPEVKMEESRPAGEKNTQPTVKIDTTDSPNKLDTSSEEINALDSDDEELYSAAPSSPSPPISPKL